MAHKSNSQISLVLNHLQEGKEISPLEALNRYGCYRLGAVIFDLIAEGYNISTEIRTFEKANGNRGWFAVYRLEA